MYVNKIFAFQTNAINKRILMTCIYEEEEEEEKIANRNTITDLLDERHR